MTRFWTLMDALRIYVEWVSTAIEATGVAVVVVGVLASSILYLRSVGRDASEAYGQLRTHLARSILIGLEFLVAGDIIRTVAVEPSLTSVAILSIIVLIRSFLSITLEMEIEGRWPWQRGTDERGQRDRTS